MGDQIAGKWFHCTLFATALKPASTGVLHECPPRQRPTLDAFRTRRPHRNARLVEAIRETVDARTMVNDVVLQHHVSALGAQPRRHRTAVRPYAQLLRQGRSSGLCRRQECEPAVGAEPALQQRRDGRQGTRAAKGSCLRKNAPFVSLKETTL